MNSISFSATLFRVSSDEDGESKVQLKVPLSDLATIAKLQEGAVGKLLKVSVTLE